MATSGPSDTKDEAAGNRAIYGGGEMGDRIRNFDWSSTDLGTIEQWPQSLRAAVNLMLQSPSPQAILWGPKGTALYNNAYIGFAGSRHPAMLGNSGPEAWPEATDFVNQVIARCLQGESIHYANLHFQVFRKGEPEDMWMDLYCSPIPDDEGKWAGVFIINRETTEEVQSVKALEESKERFTSIFDQTTVGIAETDLSGKFVLVNNRYCQIVGRSREELLGLRMQDISHPEDLPFNLPLFLRAVQKGEPFTIEKRYLRPDGTEVWVANNVSLVTDPEGKPLFIVAASHDITERKKIELEQKLFKALCENSSDFIGIATPDGQPFYINPAGREMVGLDSMEDVKKINIMDHFTPEDQQFVKDVILPTQWEKGQWVGEFRFVNFKTNTTVPVLYNQFVIKDPATGDVLGIATVSPDITEQKKWEETLKARNQELLKINNDLDNFIYTASHDLKAPILNIESLVDALAEDLPQDSAQAPNIQKLISLIRGSIARFRNTINDLTQLTKLQRQTEEKITLIGMEDLYKEICLDLETQIKNSNATLDADFSGCPAIRFSRKNLRSVLYNLMSNAIKYRAPDRTPYVRISTGKQGNQCVLTVEDNGLGIDLRQEVKIFAMFNRLHDHVEGSGIGLYIVKKIMEDSGGNIEVESKVGQGSTFKAFFCPQ